MIYLDHAATGFPKSPAVLAAVQRWFTDVGVSAARGAGDRTLVAAREVDAARAAIGLLVDCVPARVAFVSGATEGLNLALRALLGPGAHVVTTAFEHSSVVRPLRALLHERRVSFEVLPPGADGRLDIAAVQRALAARPAAVLVFTHASNVTGAVCDAAAACDAARAAGTLSLLDASQTAGWLDLRVGADVVVASGHKGLGGPPGIGFVAARSAELSPQKQGGTGHSRALDEHPTTWPDAFEAGTPNTPAIFGLAAALRERPPAVRERELAAALAVIDELAAGLGARSGWRLLGPRSGPRVPVFSGVHADFDPAEIGAYLAGHDVHVRIGHHCAPWLHRHLGTDEAGTVRFSAGPSTTPAEVQAVVRVLASLAP